MADDFVRTSVRFPAATLRRLKIMAAREGTTLTALILEAVALLFAARKAKGGE